MNRLGDDEATEEYEIPEGFTLVTVDVWRLALDGWSAIVGQAGSKIAGAAKVKGLGIELVSALYALPFPLPLLV